MGVCVGVCVGVGRVAVGLSVGAGCVAVGLSVGVGTGELTTEGVDVGKSLAVGVGVTPAPPEQDANAIRIIELETHTSKKRFNIYLLDEMTFPDLKTPGVYYHT